MLVLRLVVLVAALVVLALVQVVRVLVTAFAGLVFVVSSSGLASATVALAFEALAFVLGEWGQAFALSVQALRLAPLCFWGCLLTS